MGVSRSGKQLALKLDRLADDLEDVPYAAINQGSMIAKSAVLGFATVASGGDRRLSGVGRRGARVGVRYNITRQPDGAKSLIFATGQFHLMERDTKAGVRQRKRRSRRSKTYGPTPGYYHPGTRGKHPWARGIASVAAKLERLVAQPTTALMRRIF